MYAGVPNTQPPTVRSAASGSGSTSVELLTKPKSSTTTRSSCVTSTLLGLRSRCSLPASCSVGHGFDQLAQHAAQASHVARRAPPIGYSLPIARWLSVVDTSRTMRPATVGTARGSVIAGGIDEMVFCSLT